MLNIPRYARESIEDFQSYIAEQYRRRASTWPAAHNLIQRVAECLGEVVGYESADQVVSDVAALLSVRVRFTDRYDAKRCGYMTPTQRGFDAVVSGGPNVNHSRFTIAHECGHSLFYRGGSPPGRVVPKGSHSELDLARREEGLCDAFASALLLPSAILDALDPSDTTVSEIIRRAAQWSVSPETLLRRLLYDLQMYRHCVFYAISMPREQLSIGELAPQAMKDAGTPRVIRVFRGREMAGAQAPSRRRLQSMIESSEGPDPTARVLRAVSAVEGATDVRRRGSTLWIKLVRRTEGNNCSNASSLG